MADPPFPAIDRDLAARLDLLVPPALELPELPGDFAARLAVLAQATPQVPPLSPMPPVRRAGRWRAIGRRTRLGIAASGIALVGLGSVSAAAAGYLGEPVNHAVHRIPVVGKLIERVIPEKRRHHHAETEHAAGLGHALGHATSGSVPSGGSKFEARPVAAEAPALIVPAVPQPVIVVPGLRTGGPHGPPSWRYQGPLPSAFPPGPERRAAIARFRAFRAAHPLPPEVIALRRQRQAAIAAEQRANPAAPGLLPPRRATSQAQSDPFATTIPPEAVPPRPASLAEPQRAAALPGATPPTIDPPAFRRPELDPIAREQLRIERQRARIEARRQGLDPLAPRMVPPRVVPGQGIPAAQHVPALHPITQHPAIHPASHPAIHPAPHARAPGGFGGGHRRRG